MANTKKTVDPTADDQVKEETPLKSLTFEYNGSTYTLEFNRKTTALAEQTYGFSLPELQSGKLSYLPDLFKCALMMHHPNMKQTTADMLYTLMDDKYALMMALAELYANGVNSLLESPSEGKAISWTRH